MPLFKLIRISGLFWAAAEVLAGYGTMRFMAGPGGVWPRLPYVTASGMLLYAGARAWSDVLGAEGDLRRRPFRPLPAREITPTGAFLWAAMLTLAGLSCAMVGGYACFYFAGLAALAGLAWAAGAERVEGLGPLVAGAGRACLWLLGMGLHPSLAYLDASIYAPPALVGAHAALAAALPALSPPADWVQPPPPPPAPAAGESPIAGERRVNEEFETASAGADRKERAERAGQRGRARETSVAAADRRALAAGCMALALMPPAAAWLLPHGWIGLLLAAWEALLLTLGIRALRRPTPERLRTLAGGAWLGGVWLDAALLAGYARHTPTVLWGGWTVWLPHAWEGAWIFGIWLLIWPAWRFARHEIDAPPRVT